MGILSGSGSPHISWSTTLRMVRFLCWSEENIQICRAGFLGTVSPCYLFCCCWPSISEYKLDRHLVLTGSFCFSEWVWYQERVRQNNSEKSQWKEIVDYFYRGSKYEWLEGQEGRRFAAIKNNFENRRKELERVAESEIVLHRHIFISITGRGIKENIEK